MFQQRGEAAKKVAWPLLLLAIVAGLFASFMTHRLVSPPEPVPPPLFAGTGYAVQTPTDGWTAAPDLQAERKADLAIRATRRGISGAVFVVQVYPGVTLEELTANVKGDWQRDLPGCELLSPGELATVLVDQPAVRLRAVGRPYPNSKRDHFAGDRPYREAVVLIHDGTGYQLTYEANQRRAEGMREQIDRLFAGFQPASQAMK